MSEMIEAAASTAYPARTKAALRAGSAEQEAKLVMRAPVEAEQEAERIIQVSAEQETE